MTTRRAADVAFYALVALVLALVLWMHAHHTATDGVRVELDSGEGALV